ncbi:hypothetical protein TURU_106438 [Turdus rufiventris]|nr:hypothetical protein TURU_106438 [Turdus rufiventris]
MDFKKKFGEGWLESCLIEKPTEHEIVCAQVANKSNSILAWMNNSVTSRTWALTVPLYSALVSSHLKSFNFGPLTAQKTEMLEYVQRRAMELGKGVEHKSCEEWLRELEVLRLEKKRLRGDLIVLYNCLEGGCSQVVFDIFFQKASGRTRGAVFKEHQGTFRLDIRKKIIEEIGLSSMRTDCPCLNHHPWKGAPVDVALRNTF